MFFNFGSKKENSAHQKFELQIVGMHCSSCAINVDFALEDLPGVIAAKTRYAQQTAQITFDPSKTHMDEIIAAIKKLGYDAIPKSTQ